MDRVKNKLIDLHNHLFEQLERLNNDELSPEEIAREVQRTDAIVQVSEQIISGATVSLRAAELLAEHGGRGTFEHLLPSFGVSVKSIEGPKK